jgi:glycosyltransferase involved in cell wall biosynthesis
MKILIISDVYPPYASGVSTVTFNLATGLAKLGHQVVVLTVGGGLRSKIEFNGFLKVVRLPSVFIPLRKEMIVSPLALMRVLKIIQKEAPEVVHIHTFFGLGIAGYFAAKKVKIPVVATNHILPGNVVGFLPFGGLFEGLISAQLWRYNRFFYQRCAYVTAPTQTALDVLKKHVPLKNAAAVSNGIDLSKFGPRVFSKEEARRRLGLEDLPWILFVGRLAKEKRVDFLLKAFVLLEKKLKTGLLIVGTGPEELALRNLTKRLRLKEVFFSGFVSEEKLKDYYQAADVFVLPSKSELQGLVCLEAAAYGVPLIGAKSVALPELIKDGVNGYLFNPESETDLAEKLLKILSSKGLQEELRKGALESVRRHDLSQTIKNYEAIYSECVRKNQGEKQAMKQVS